MSLPPFPWARHFHSSLLHSSSPGEHIIPPNTTGLPYRSLLHHKDKVKKDSVELQSYMLDATV